MSKSKKPKLENLTASIESQSTGLMSDFVNNTVAKPQFDKAFMVWFTENDHPLSNISDMNEAWLAGVNHERSSTKNKVK